MKVIANFCQSHIEEALQPLKHIPFTLHGETHPSDADLALNPINIYYLSEPPEYFDNHSWISNNADKFDIILTWNKDHLRDLPNAVFTPFGTTPYWDRLNIATGEGLPVKEDKVTFIRGAKHFDVPGHHLRHELYDRRFEIKNIKSEFYDKTTPEYASNDDEAAVWFRQRTSVFSSPLFHICIENTLHENYFTEKIMDAFLFRTVPIYYGCPNIGKFFDKEGIITFGNVDELIYLCNHLTYEDYRDRLFSVYANQITALKYIHLGGTIRDTLLDIFEKRFPGGYIKLLHDR